ncbi:hypothetical protein KEM52_003441 [Ascosphaera acerosa]|nr:hypothetical protein KEM52_003441 [Ascosphaera acerosa]
MDRSLDEIIAERPDLFNRIGPVTNLHLRYDRAGRSDGVAFVTYRHLDDAKEAIREFDGANAKGQPIRLTLLSSGRRLADYIEPPHRSLFDRVERPRNRGRTDRSLSPMDEDADEDERGGRSDRRRARGEARANGRGGVDRYVPPGARDGGRDRGRDRDRERDRDRSRGRSPPPRNGRRSQPGRRQQSGTTGEKPSGRAARTKKTQEELDQEMEDYWNATSNDPVAATGALPAQDVAPADPAAAGLAPPAVGEALPAQTPAPAATNGAAAAAQNQAQNAATADDDDIDMIE